MGCKCNKDAQIDNNQIKVNREKDKNKIKKQTEDGITSLKNGLTNDNSSLNTNKINSTDYAKEMIDIINQIRTNPSGYADFLLSKKENVITEKDKKIYKQKVKVAMFRGEEAFDEAAMYLRQLSPLPPFLFKDQIVIPFPEDEEIAKNKNYIEQQLNRIEEEENIIVGTFFKELVKLPEVSALLMIVDDTGKNSGKKRKALLSENYKYIGISSKFYGKTFISYFTFTE